MMQYITLTVQTAVSGLLERTLWWKSHLEDEKYQTMGRAVRVEVPTNQMYAEI